MNRPFVKMLQFEFKLNYMEWIFHLIFVIPFTLLIIFPLQNKHTFFNSGDIFPICIFISWLFTINSYQESTKSQMMRTYHLIPVSLNMKFFSKQLITFIVFPLLLSFLMFICVSISDVFTTDNSSVRAPLQNYLSLYSLLVIWIFGHSVCTLIANIFKKKNKIRYAISVYFFYFVTIAFLKKYFEFEFSIKSFFDFSRESFQLYHLGLLSLLILIFYGLSYRLFIRRQL